MKILRWLILIAVWLVWITYGKEYMTPYLQIQFGEQLGYIASSAVTFIGGWVMWQMILKRKA